MKKDCTIKEDKVVANDTTENDKSTDIKEPLDNKISDSNSNDESNKTDTNIEEVKKPSKNKKSLKKKLLLIIIPILVIIALAISGYFVYNKYFIYPENVIVADNSFHAIKLSWDYSKDESYEVIISSKEFSKDSVFETLKNNVELEDDYQIFDNQNQKEISINNLPADTDYYAVIITYHNSKDKKVYSSVSKLLTFHTASLDIKPIEDLTLGEVTDTSVDLSWSNWKTNEKNIDGSDIEITYTLLSTDSKTNETTKITDIKENKYTAKELSPFTNYKYQVVINATIDGKESSSKESNLVETMTKSEMVNNLQATSSGTSSIKLTWDKYDKLSLKNDDESDVTYTYSIYGSDSQDGEYSMLSENVAEESYTESNLDSNKTRFYYVIVTFTYNNQKYESVKSNIVSATTDKTNYSAGTNYSGGYSSSSSGSSSGGSSASSKEAQARVIARQIASSITGGSDLEKIQQAARIVQSYYSRCVYKETGSDYYTAYGVFIKGEASCAGTTSALGMVLEEMGYSWTHVNKNQWAHQWVVVYMDGQVGWADGQIGLAGYGKHPVAG